MAATWTTQAWDAGGAVSYGGTTVYHSPFAGVVVRFHGTDAARTIHMPKATHWPNGNLFAVVCNEQTTNTVTIKDSAGTTLGTVATGKAAKVFLIENDTSAGVWLVRQAGDVST